MVPIPMPNIVKNDDRQPPQKLDHLHSTAVPTSGLLHSTDLIPRGAAASDLSAWLHWTRLGLSSGSSHCHFRAEAWLSLAEFVAFWRCAMAPTCSLPGAAFSEGQEGQQQERYRVLRAGPGSCPRKEVEQNSALLS